MWGELASYKDPPQLSRQGIQCPAPVYVCCMLFWFVGVMLLLWSVVLYTFFFVIYRLNS